MVNVELFEVCETIPKVQCTQCLLYWNQGVIYCTCGHFLVESESRRKLYKLRLDALSFPHCVIKKGRPHGARHCKLKNRISLHSLQRVEEMSQKSWRSRRTLQRNSRSFSKRPKSIVIRNSKLAEPRRSASQWIFLAQEDHSYRLIKEEFKRGQGQWYLTMKKSGKNAPMRLRSDLRAAVTIKNKGGTLLPQAIPRGTGTRPKAGGAAKRWMKVEHVHDHASKVHV